MYKTLPSCQRAFSCPFWIVPTLLSRNNHHSDIFPPCKLLLPVLEFHINRVLQHVLFCVCLLSLSIILLKSIHVVVYFNSPFHFIAQQYSISCTHHSLSVFLWMDTWIVFSLGLIWGGGVGGGTLNFYFKKIDFYLLKQFQICRKIKNIVQRVPTYLYPISPVINILHLMSFLRLPLTQCFWLIA